MPKKIIYAFSAAVVILCLLAVFCVKPSPVFLFKNAQDDCSARSIFLYNTLYKNNSDADVVFFGSSKTMNGINDSMMSRTGGQTFLNLGYCRFGRNLDYFFIEEYCKKHHPKKLVLEVRERESSNSHPVAPFFLSPDQLMAGAFSFNGCFFPDLYNVWLCHLKYIRQNLFDGSDTVIAAIDPKSGFFYGYKKPDPQPLIEQRKRDSVTIAQNYNGLTEKLNYNSELYFKKLQSLCKARNIKLYLLYLSSYGNLWKTPASYTSYLQYGTYLSIPDSILNDVNNFSDFGHFNLQGADKASLWLMSQLKE